MFARPIFYAFSFVLIVGIIFSGFIYRDSAFTAILLLTWGFITLQHAFRTGIWVSHPLSYVMLAYLLWLLIVSASSAIPDASLFTAGMLMGLPIAYLTWTNIPNPTRLWAALRIAFWLGGVFLASWAIWQVMYHIGYGQAVGPLIDRNAFAALINAFWFPAAFWLFIRRPPQHGWMPTLLSIGLFILSVALFATTSRGGIATWLLLLPILLWAGYRHSRSKSAAVLVLIIALLAYACSTYLLHSSIADRTFQLAQDASTNARLLIWQSTLHMILAHPWIGTGWGTFIAYYPAYQSPLEKATSGFFAHNDYLQLAAEGGIVALLLVLGMVAGLLLQLKRSLRQVAKVDGLESVALLLGALALFIHASVNFIFYFAFMNVIAGLYLARAAQLVEPAKLFQLPLCNQISHPVKNVMAGAGGLLLATPFIIHLTAQLCLTGTQPGLKALQTVFPSVNTYNMSLFLTRIYPEEGIAQGYLLNRYYQSLVHGNGADMPEGISLPDYLSQVLAQYDFVRSKTGNNPNLGVREVEILVKFRPFFGNDSAFTKAHQILSDNLKDFPFHVGSMIMLSRLQVAEGHNRVAINTLQQATHHVLTLRDYQLLQVEILRRQAAPRFIAELDTLEQQLHTVRSDAETGKQLILAPHFNENIDQRLQAIAVQLPTNH